MSSQPVTGDQFTRITAAGTTVVKNISGNVQRILVPGTFVGSVTIHDSATAAGTSATTPIFVLGLPASSIPQSIEVGARCKDGITYEAAGTPTCTIIWD